MALACLVVAGSVHAAAEAKPPSQAPKREQAIETLKGESKATRRARRPCGSCSISVGLA